MKKHKHIAIDTMILVYLLERNLSHIETIKKTLKHANRVTLSGMGFGEILAGFEKSNDQKGKLKFLSFLESFKKISVASFNKDTALTFAKLRAKYPSIKSPDAIHVATAIQAKADIFLTNDKNLKQVEEIRVITLI